MQYILNIYLSLSVAKRQLKMAKDNDEELSSSHAQDDEREDIFYDFQTSDEPMLSPHWIHWYARNPNKCKLLTGIEYDILKKATGLFV